MRTLSVQTDLSINPMAEVGLFTNHHHHHHHQEEEEEEEERTDMEHDVIFQQQQHYHHQYLQGPFDHHEQLMNSPHLMSPFRDAIQSQMPTPLKSAAEALAFLSPIGSRSGARQRNVLVTTPGFSPYSRREYAADHIISPSTAHYRASILQESTKECNDKQNSSHRSRNSGSDYTFRSGKRPSSSVAKKLNFGDDHERDGRDVLARNESADEIGYHDNNDDEYSLDDISSNSKTGSSRTESQQLRRNKSHNSSHNSSSRRSFGAPLQDVQHYSHQQTLHPVIQCPHCQQQVLCHVSVTPVATHQPMDAYILSDSTYVGGVGYRTPGPERRQTLSNHVQQNSHATWQQSFNQHYQYPYSYSTGTKYRSLYSPPLPPLPHNRTSRYTSNGSFTTTTNSAMSISPTGRKPLSPSNFEFFRQRYYRQIRYYEDK